MIRTIGEEYEQLAEKARSNLRQGKRDTGSPKVDTNRLGMDSKKKEKEK